MRLNRLILWDIRFQWKYGFYFIYFILAILYLGIIRALPADLRQKTAAVLIYSDPAAMGLLFMGAIVLLEKSQKVLNAMAVSPVKVSEYILAKTAALIPISCIVAAVIGIAAETPELPVVIAGTALTSAVFTLIGILAAAKISGLNQFLITIIPIEILCFIPPVLNHFVELPRGFRFFPFMACMNLIAGDSQFLLFDLTLVLLTVVVLYRLAWLQVAKMWQSIGGVRI